MASGNVRLKVVRTLCALGVILGAVACSAKSPTVGTIKSKVKGGDEDVEVNKSSKTPTLGEESSGRGSSDGDAEEDSLDEVAANTPVKSPDSSTKPDDDTIIPPVPQTGGNGDDNKADPLQTVKNGFYFIKALGSSKCLSIPSNSKENGVQLEQRSCETKSDAQKFEIEFLPSEKAYSIVNRASNKVLEVRDQIEAPQVAIQQGDYFGLKHQMFNFEAQDGKYRIKTKVKGLFVNVSGASVANGALIQLWHEGNVTSSTWILEPTL